MIQQYANDFVIDEGERERERERERESDSILLKLFAYCCIIFFRQLFKCKMINLNKNVI